MSQYKNMRHIPALLSGIVPAYFAVGLFSFFYTSRFAFVSLSLFFSFAFAFFSSILVDAFLLRLRVWRSNVGGILALLLAAGLALASLLLCLQYPSLFERRLLLMGQGDLPLFAAMFMLAAIAAFLLSARLERNGLIIRLLGWVRAHLSGLLLSSFFFLTYFVLASTINFPGFKTVDQYFDLDISTWLARFQTADPWAITDRIRAVHPAVMVLLRPFIWITSQLLHGDRLYGVFLFHSIVASACVFLVWKIVRRATASSSLGLIAATLLGASTSHLLLGAMVETYIYSALALLVVVSVLQEDKIPFVPLVASGVVAFGITIANFAQSLILYFIKQPRVKPVFLYAVTVTLTVFILNLVQVQVYPAASSLWPTSLDREKKFQSGLWENRKRMVGRTILTGRTVLIYGVVAPQPFILTEELGTTLPSFRTYRQTPGNFQVAGFQGLGDPTAAAWIFIVAMAGLLFALDWLKGPHPVLATGLLAVLGFNFVLHVVYGDDPLLYSPDWVYALVLLVAFSFRRFASRLWLQVPLAVFLIPLTIVNLGLIRQIMEVSVPLYGG